MKNSFWLLGKRSKKIMDISKSFRISVISLLAFCMFFNGAQGAETLKDDASDEMDFAERMMMMKSSMQ